MKRRTTFSAAAVATTLMIELTPNAYSAIQGDAEGDTQMCIDTQFIDSTPVIDSKTSLVKMRGSGKGYKRMDLLNNCGLDRSKGFAWSTSLNKLCKQDTLHVIETAGRTCMIDKIVTISE